MKVFLLRGWQQALREISLTTDDGGVERPVSEAFACHFEANGGVKWGASFSSAV